MAAVIRTASSSTIGRLSDDQKPPSAATDCEGEFAGVTGATGTLNAGPLTLTTGFFVTIVGCAFLTGGLWGRVAGFARAAFALWWTVGCLACTVGVAAGAGTRVGVGAWVTGATGWLVAGAGVMGVGRRLVVGVAAVRECFTAAGEGSGWGFDCACATPLPTSRVSAARKTATGPGRWST